MSEEFNAEEYWSTRKVKKWVVRIGGGTKIVASKTKEGAEKGALENQYGKKYKMASARLATPRDLGIMT